MSTERELPMETGKREDGPETLIHADRVAEVRSAYEAIGRQIAILRRIDLGDVNPAVVFRPTRRPETL